MGLKAIPKLLLCYLPDYQVCFLLCFSKRPEEPGQTQSVTSEGWLGMELWR